MVIIAYRYGPNNPLKLPPEPSSNLINLFCSGIYDHFYDPLKPHSNHSTQPAAAVAYKIERCGPNIAHSISQHWMWLARALPTKLDPSGPPPIRAGSVIIAELD